MTNFAANLVLLRHSFNISQLGIASLLGVPTTVIRKYENSTAEPDIKGLQRISELFEISLQTLLTKDIRTDYRLLIRKTAIHSVPSHSVSATAVNQFVATTIFCAQATEGVETMVRYVSQFDLGEERRKLKNILDMMRGLISINQSLVSCMKHHLS